MKIYDITAEISSALPFYSENDPFKFDRVLRLENGDACNLSRVTMSVHTGTHADMPLHFIENGAACDEISLEHFYGKAKLFRLHHKEPRNISKNDLLPLDIQAGDIILLDTGQSCNMSKPLKKDYTALSPCAAKFLTEKKIKTVGLDYISADTYNAEGFPVHHILLGNGIAILEGLVLQNVPEGEYEISALPLKFKGGEGSPVRAILVARHG
ncbi:MAG: cyclase family protein [Defluviitaleaceae bacterium]|nr:cyclase family protein [Defluviitaleaceae bacterium]